MGEVKEKKSGGLAGVIAADSSICLCGAEDESLLYRGYSIEDLIKKSSFEEVAWLLLRGELPTKEELESYRKELRDLRYLPEPLKQHLEKIPQDTNMMDVLRSGISLLGNYEPERKEFPKFGIADRLIASLPSILLYWYQFHILGERIDLNTGEDSHSDHILHLLLGKKPFEMHQKCLDMALILYAEHEFNASTFVVRSIASTLSDFYSAICGGVGTLRGPLHGGANEKALELIESFEDPDQAEKGIISMLEKKELVMGFGHRVYKLKDPRTIFMKEWAKKFSSAIGDDLLYPIAEKIEDVMWRKKNLFPNIDFYSGLAFHYLGIPTPMFTPIFAFSRISGWSSHLLEQRENNRLIRPLSNYTGPKLRVYTQV